ncbi:hypothetical protein FRC08_009427 [Ceratobasidium sp. 394]|nr:hypothetical protein FRC08_009427 [Ceratobasidium sp. 394]
MNLSARLIHWGERTAEGERFIEGSFASSGALLAQASKWFGSNSRESPCLMRFHQDWQHEKCPVMAWYKLQQISSTTIQSIQHRRDSEGPFFHEFLLLRLSDDAVCRVERTGEGSRIDALRNIGCVANDYIQHFSAASYEAFTLNKPSELIAEAHFPSAFDIMDVLAICYAIYIRPRTRTYTLQRFNCYFLCNTILLALSRRFLRWEATVTSDTWKNELNQALDQLVQASRDPASNHLLFRVCRLLEPGNPGAAEFFFKVFRDRLGGEPDAYNALKRALAETLWQSSWTTNMNRSITGHVNAAVTFALDGAGKCAQVFKSATCDGKKVLKEKHETFSVVNKIFNKHAAAAMSDGVRQFTEASEEQYRLEKIERPRSILRYAWVHLASHALGLWFPVQMLMASDSEMEEWGFRDVLLSSPRGVLAGQTLGRLQSRRSLAWIVPSTGPAPIKVGKTMAIETATTAPPFMVQVNYDMASRSLDKTLEELASRDMLTVPNMTIALHATLCKNIWDDWLNKSLRDMLKAVLPDMLPKDEGIKVKIPMGGDSIEMKSVSQYQEYVRERIEAHARRVEAYRLAAAHFVTEDIQEAMTAVWKLIPPGYASCVTST